MLKPKSKQIYKPVQRARKFSAVWGTSSPYNPITIFPASLPTGFPILISKNTLFVIFDWIGATYKNSKRKKKMINTKYLQNPKNPKPRKTLTSAAARTVLRTRWLLVWGELKRGKRNDPEKELDEDEILRESESVRGKLRELQDVEMGWFLGGVLGDERRPTFDCKEREKMRMVMKKKIIRDI